jgi:peptidylprolyl isomerase
VGRSPGDDKARAKPLPPGLLSVPQGAYTLTAGRPRPFRARVADGVYAVAERFYQGWPIATGPGTSPKPGRCIAMAASVSARHAA